MEYFELAPGFKVSRILTGLKQKSNHNKPELDHKSLQPYLEAGFTSFDVSDPFESPDIVSDIYSQSYNENGVQFLTKWIPRRGPVSREDVRTDIENSLKRLNCERIDLLQYHAWNYADPSWLDGIFYLQELKEEGLIRNLGLMNFDTPHLRMVIKSGIRVTSNQVSYSLIDQRAAGEMTRLCVNYGVKLLSFGTVAGGFLSEKWLNKPEPKESVLGIWPLIKYKRFIDRAGGWNNFQILLRTIKEIADDYQVSMANIAAKFILEQPAVGGIIIGARLGESEHIKDNQRLFQFNIEENHKHKIREALQILDPVPGDCGDEYRKSPFLGLDSAEPQELPRPYEIKKDDKGRTKVNTKTVWEDAGGFSRAVRKGNRIWVSGTIATHNNKTIGGYDPKAQTHFIIDKIEGALNSLGATLDDVVRTRIFVQDIDDWDRVSKVHWQRFKDIRPANTIVQAELGGEGFLVEMEAEAEVYD